VAIFFIKSIDAGNILWYIIRVVEKHSAKGTKMMPPKCITEKETPETKAISKIATDTLFDASISDDTANAVIRECNAKLDALGMPPGAHVILRGSK
jgi:hypothetical protein